MKRQRKQPCEGEPPKEVHETEADRQLKALLSRQLDKNYSLEIHAKHQRQFTEGITFEDTSKKFSGVVSLLDYKQTLEHISTSEFIETYGLTSAELELLLDTNSNETNCEVSQETWALTREAQREAVIRKIQERHKVLSQPDTFHGTKQLTRHEWELEKSIHGRASTSAKPFLKALTTRSQLPATFNSNTDPINHLDEMLAEIVQRARRERKQKKKKKRATTAEAIMEKQDDYVEVNKPFTATPSCGKSTELTKLHVTHEETYGEIAKQNVISNNVNTAVVKNLCSSHSELTAKSAIPRIDASVDDELDSQVVPKKCITAAFTNSEISASRKRERRRKRKKLKLLSDLQSLCNDSETADGELSNTNTFDGDIATCAEKPAAWKSSFSCDKNEQTHHQNASKELKYTRYVVPIPEEMIVQNRVSLEEICNMPRFSNYSPGEPSKTLYLKNLTKDVTEANLVAMFSRFEKPGCAVNYKLCSGRMRGQAFVSFPDEEVANQALQLVNGFVYKGKPIIVQFGTKSC